MKVVILGAPGAGKGTQANMIATKYNIPHIATGDILRANIKEETDLGKKAEGYISQGMLVPDELVCDLLIDRIIHSDCENGYILDGFPRTIPQAQALDEYLKKEGHTLDCAINIEVSDERIVKRVCGRRACLGCGRIYHMQYKPPEKVGVCDACGDELFLRDDDAEETVKKRLRVYHEQTQPLIDYYNRVDILKTIDGTKSIEEVFGIITEILGA